MADEPTSRTPRFGFAIARVRGISIRIHGTFLLLLAFIAYRSWQETSNPLAVAHAIALVLAVFACVALHELGHALVALHFGVRTKDITLYPIGGVARLERIPERPLHELLVAFAGPLVNFVIAAVLGVTLHLLGHATMPPESGEPGFFVALIWINLGLGLFNLVPAFPLDGGRVLRDRG